MQLLRVAVEVEQARQHAALGVVAQARAKRGPSRPRAAQSSRKGPSGVGLPPNYALFGKVISGLDVLDQIEKVRTGAGDRPVEDVVINSITITEE